MSGASGPISIPLPTAGFAVFSGEHVREPISIPLPTAGFAVFSGEHVFAGWHIGSLRFGSTAIAGTAFTGWT